MESITKYKTDNALIFVWCYQIGFPKRALILFVGLQTLFTPKIALFDVIEGADEKQFIIID
ncbi:hypothetical protein AT246_02290 [Bartonella henselae]|nr:hypothetical protein AT247_06200 [Bartonella henselae]OLL51344.1 hypothetical protein AT243_07235 [Bartonella henselae]OLL51628.1 hypothetical protein AT241_05210 [Bartonella henselae]OLL55492.1 hypothetical protein AT240_06725 [Bartonella henselae]OLL55677.1 hypothetical protein AT239_06030 [Bartonella henselae]